MLCHLFPIYFKPCNACKTCAQVLLRLTLWFHWRLKCSQVMFPPRNMQVICITPTGSPSQRQKPPFIQCVQTRTWCYTHLHLRTRRGVNYSAHSQACFPWCNLPHLLQVLALYVKLTLTRCWQIKEKLNHLQVMGYVRTVFSIYCQGSKRQTSSQLLTSLAPVLKVHVDDIKEDKLLCTLLTNKGL